MKRQSVRGFTPLPAAVLMLLFAVFAGCERKPEVYTVRGRDPVYQQELKEQIDRQKRTAKSKAKIQAQIARLEGRAKAVLPPGATAEQITAEMDAHPEKYPGWKTLSAALAEAIADEEKELADARRVVRQRIQKEAADRKAVEKGEAVAKSAASK